jgi:hypothetical protein
VEDASPAGYPFREATVDAAVRRRISVAEHKDGRSDEAAFTKAPNLLLAGGDAEPLLRLPPLGQQVAGSAARN